MAYQLHPVEYEEEYEMDEDEDEELFDVEHADRMRNGGDAFGSDSEDAEMAASGTDTNSAQAQRGKDIQGIPWARFQFTRENYRKTRLEQYKNYENLNQPHELIEKECKKVEKDGQFFDFRYNTRQMKSTIVHFQLRNLVWATSKHDVYVMHQYAINHWSPLSRKCTKVLNLGGHEGFGAEQGQSPYTPAHDLGKVQISTMCARKNLLVAGGFRGEMVCKILDRQGLAFSARITYDDNAITNAIEIFDAPSGATRILSSNNDSIVRVFDTGAFQSLSKFHFPWAVNHTSASPDGKLMVVVGDDPQGLLADTQSGKAIATLTGHLDFSFASAWHPDGRVFATGNQDTSCRLWDIRYLGSSLATLMGRMGAIRSLRFSSDGKFLAMAEPADFVHVFDAKQDYAQSQEIDLFGEVAGISFSPDGESLYIGVADRTYGSLLEYNRHHSDTFYNCWV
eukprot:TRINITY_DN1043_c0_g1_i1.p1 TRINITY_DN1043_c0_g1~~TRINITY_DN1043_c0_g1_i1.p1  ORF type:complete len:481 (+),score=80.33 TRINITY_DN1043_c0_g1_i1:88-1443(+)